VLKIVSEYMMGRFVEIEQRYTDVVRFELHYASQNDFSLDFAEMSVEAD